MGILVLCFFRQKNVNIALLTAPVLIFWNGVFLMRHHPNICKKKESLLVFSYTREQFYFAAESMLISSLDSTNLGTPTTIPILDTDNKLDIESTCPLFEQQNVSSQDQIILPVDSNNEPVVEETFSSVEFTSGPSVENKTDDSSSCESCTDDQSSSDNQLGSPRSSGRGYRGCTTQHRSKGGSRRQHGRGRNKSTDEEQLFDKLPSYYTVFSRPYRTATGLVRNSSISSVDIIRKSGTLDRDRDPSPDRDNLVLDKVPAYQSCYTNSSKYDEDMLNSWNKTGYNVALNDDEPTSFGRGCSNRRFSNRTRSRSRSKSRGMTRSRGRPLLKSGSHGHHSNNIKEMRFASDVCSLCCIVYCVSVLIPSLFKKRNHCSKLITCYV